ncbi:hypothetical protein GCM10009753_36300 [Streptantibioticus ferralitis]
MLVERTVGRCAGQVGCSIVVVELPPPRIIVVVLLPLMTHVVIVRRDAPAETVLGKRLRFAMVRVLSEVMRRGGTASGSLGTWRPPKCGLWDR